MVAHSPSPQQNQPPSSHQMPSLQHTHWITRTLFILQWHQIPTSIQEIPLKYHQILQYVGVSYQFSSTSSPWPSTLATTTDHPIQISKRISTSYTRTTTNWMETTLLWTFYHNMDLHTRTETNKRKYQTQWRWAMAHGSHCTHMDLPTSMMDPLQ